MSNTPSLGEQAVEKLNEIVWEDVSFADYKRMKGTACKIRRLQAIGASEPWVYQLAVQKQRLCGGCETGWLIERGSAATPEYLTIYERKTGWTLDHNTALRFSRREDAQRLSDHFLLTHSGIERIAQHSWDAQPCQQPASVGCEEWTKANCALVGHTPMCDIAIGPNVVALGLAEPEADLLIQRHNAALRLQSAPVEAKFILWCKCNPLDRKHGNYSPDCPAHSLRSPETIRKENEQFERVTQGEQKWNKNK